MRNINIVLDDEEVKEFDKAQALLSGNSEKVMTQKELIVYLVHNFLSKKVKKSG